jgi:hypothetical protein
MSADLEHNVAALAARGKGIVAADETVPTLTRRFDALGKASTAQTRQTYREMPRAAPTRLLQRRRQPGCLHETDGRSTSRRRGATAPARVTGRLSALRERGAA